MIGTLELIPTELFFAICSYLSWNEILTSFWSLNQRLNFLVASTFSTNQRGVVINQTGLSYKIWSQLAQLISSCPSLVSSIRHIHLDGTHSNIGEFFNQKRIILQYPNLQSLILTQCYLSESLIENLSWLIEHRLTALTLILDEDIPMARNVESEIGRKMSRSVFAWADQWNRPRGESTNIDIKYINIRQRSSRFEEFVPRLFSRQCQLESLRLSIPDDEFSMNIYQRLPWSKDSGLNLRYLDLRIHVRYFLHVFIEHAPNLERLSVHLESAWVGHGLFDSWYGSRISSYKQLYSHQKLSLPKLKSFTLKDVIADEFQLNYLKWILSNVNHVEKLSISLKITQILKNDLAGNGLVIDANFLHQYFLADPMINLIHFDFNIISKCDFISNKIESIIHSFQIHPFFIEHQWTNVTCEYDLTNSYQHLSSSQLQLSPYFQYLSYRDDIFARPRVKYFLVDFNEIPDLLLNCFDQLFPKVTWMKFSMPIDRRPNISSFHIEQHQSTNIHLQYVTRLDFQTSDGFDRKTGRYTCGVGRCEERSRILARLISMPYQLKYLRIEQFDWLVDLVEYSFDRLKKNALTSVRYVEFGLPSCNYGTSPSASLGKSLIPFLSTHLPHLQTLRLWRPDDFPWTTIRPYFKRPYNARAIVQWQNSLETPESINKSTIAFEKDLSELGDKLKHFVYLDISGQTNLQKLDKYRSMVERCFPDASFSIELTRFRFWI